jgi:hypothetical protein
VRVHWRGGCGIIDPRLEKFLALEFRFLPKMPFCGSDNNRPKIAIVSSTGGRVCGDQEMAARL